MSIFSIQAMAPTNKVVKASDSYTGLLGFNDFLNIPGHPDPLKYKPSSDLKDVDFGSDCTFGTSDLALSQKTYEESERETLEKTVPRYDLRQQSNSTANMDFDVSHVGGWTETMTWTEGMTSKLGGDDIQPSPQPSNLVEWPLFTLDSTSRDTDTPSRSSLYRPRPRLNTCGLAN